MKFSCERCGKRYATAEAPAPGKVYRMRCKACGNAITVRVPAASAPAAAPPARAAATPPPTAVPGAAAPGPAATGEGGYVDLFADGEPAGEEQPLVGADAISELVLADTPAPAPAPAAPSPELELAPAAAVAPPEPAFLPPRDAGPRVEPPRPVPSIPGLPRQPRTGGPPLALIAIGVVILLGILAFVLWGPGRKHPEAPANAVAQAAPAPSSPPSPPPAAASAPAPAPRAADPAPAEHPAPSAASAAGPPRAAEPAPAAPANLPKAAAPAAAAERRIRVEKAPPAKQRRVAATAPRTSGKAPAAAAPSPEPELAADDEPAAPTGLTDAQIDGVLRSTKKAFDACLDRAKAAGPQLAGRRVLLRLEIKPTGAVAYPTLDDVTLSGTELGGCLKSAARLMVFPAFKGDPLHVEVPFVVP